MNLCVIPLQFFLSSDSELNSQPAEIFHGLGPPIHS
uniref:Uncharacterized protein n=1 Tax=Anguilla anguilla TaxID=7936 RepID=A0A0E9QMW3_ANGAN